MPGPCLESTAPPEIVVLESAARPPKFTWVFIRQYRRAIYWTIPFEQLIRESGAVHMNDARITDPKTEISKPGEYFFKVGNRRFLKLVVR